MTTFHVKGLLGGVLIGAIAGLISALVDGHVQVTWVVLAVFVVFVANLATGLVRRLQTTYTVTTERLTIERGLMTRELHETRLERVQNVNLRQSLLERALGVGTVDFDTAGGAAYDFSFIGVAEPKRLVRTVDTALREGLGHPSQSRG
jgi:putative membrane protein